MFRVKIVVLSQRVKVIKLRGHPQTCVPPILWSSRILTFLIEMTWMYVSKDSLSIISYRLELFSPEDSCFPSYFFLSFIDLTAIFSLFQFLTFYFNFITLDHIQRDIAKKFDLWSASLFFVDAHSHKHTTTSSCSACVLSSVWCSGRVSSTLPSASGKSQLARRFSAH